MEQEITAHSEGEAHGPDRLQVFLTRSFVVAAVLGFAVFAVPYGAGVSVKQASGFWAEHWAGLTTLGLAVLTIWCYRLVEHVVNSLVDHYSARMAAVRNVFAAMSVCCFLVFCASAVVGISRGYAVQSDWPLVVFFEGVVLLAVGSWSRRRIHRMNFPFVILLLLCCFPLKGKEWLALLCVLFMVLPAILKLRIIANMLSERQRARIRAVSWLIFLVAFVIWMASTPRQRHFRNGQSYYSERRFEDALMEFEAEARDWSRHILYEPYDDGMLMSMLAKTYCQLGRFEEARRTYEVLGERYVNRWADDVAKDLKRLDEGLTVVGRYEAWVKGQEEFPYDLRDIWGPQGTEIHKYHVLSEVARKYRYDLRCDAKVLEVYTRMLELDVSGDKKASVEMDVRQLRLHGPL